MKKQVKRFAAGLFLLLFSVPFLAFGVSAESSLTDFQSNYWFNVLDYSYVGNTGSSNFSYVNDLENIVTFNLPESVNFFYTIDMIVEFYDTNVPTGVYFVSPYHGKIPLTMTKIDGTFYRVYGNIGRADGATHRLSFDFSASGYRWVNVYKCDVLRTWATSVGIDATADLSYGSKDFSFTYDASNPEANKNASFYGSGNVFDYVVYINFSQDVWKNYDYIDVQLLVATQMINSVTAVCNGQIPFSVNKIECADRSGNWYLTIRIDLRNVDRTVNDYPMIIINGTAKTSTSSLNLFAFTSVTGSICLPEINQLFLYFNNLHDWLMAGFDSVVEALGGGDSTGGDPLPDAVSQQDSINSGVAAINGVSKPDISSSDLDISEYGSGFSSYGVILSTPLNHSSTIFNVFMITFILMMGAYILFGKRG